MRQRLFSRILILCGLLLGYQLQAQDAGFTYYGVTYGLGRQDVTAIFLDSRDILWVGTKGAGLYQFGPGRFSQNLIGPDATGYDILEIAEDENGYLYLLSEKGVLQFDGRNVIPIAEGSDIHALAMSNTGLWWLNKERVFRRQDDKVESLTEQIDVLMPGYAHDRDMVALTSGAMLFIDQQMKVRQSIKFEDGEPKKWMSAAYAPDSTIWAIASDGTLLHFNGFDFSLHETGIAEATDIATGSLGTLWLTSAHGVFVYQTLDSSLHILQSDVPVRCVFFDRYNRLWMGSPEEGLIRYFGEQHRTWSRPDRLPVTALFAGKSVDDTRVLAVDGTISLLSEPLIQYSLPCNESSLQQVYQDKMARLWAMCDAGLWMRGDTTWIKMDSSAQIAEWAINGSDHSGNLWLSKQNEVLRYGIKAGAFPVGLSFVKYPIAGNIPADRSVGVFSCTDGSVIRVGTNTVGILKGDQYTQTHQLGFNCRSATVDSSCHVWLGGEAAGIFRVHAVRGDVQKPLLTTYPLRTSDVIFLKHTRHAVFAGTDRNLLRFHTDTSGLRVTTIDDMNGDAGIVLQDMRNNKYAVTGDGHVLVISGGSVIDFDITSSDADRLAPSVYLTRVEVNGTDFRDTEYRDVAGAFYLQKAIPKFRASEDNITFSFAGASADDEFLKYQWRLQPEAEWSAPSAQTEVILSALSPGAYAFQVRVCDPAGNCGQLPYSWKFAIEKAYWQYAWFQAGVVLLLLTVGAVFLFTRMKRKRKEADRERQRLETELNALELEQKSLQLQMNPHFIFNALQSLRGRIREDNLPDARNHLTQFAKLMRLMLEMSRKSSVTLEEELDFLDAYASVEKVNHQLPVEYSAEIVAGEDSHAMHLPPMLIQPVLENAFKYGGDGEKIRVRMSAVVEGHLLVVRIEDNGKGFGSHTPSHKSAGLEIIDNRLKRLGRNGGIQKGTSSLGGALVELRIPLSE